MSAELRVTEHTVTPGRQVCEVLWDGVLVATVTTDPDDRLVRVITKHPARVNYDPPSGIVPGVANVVLEP